MTAKYFALLTNQGAAKLANATALGTQLSLTQMAVGDGGGVLPTPDPAQTQLIGEKRRASLNSLSVDPANTNQIIAEQIIPEDQGGFWIREIGLFDQDNTLIAIANCPETYKPQLQEGSGRTQTVRMIIVVSSTDAVTLKIDPSIVLATRKYVDDKVIEVKAYTDDQLAKHVAAANPHAQYDIPVGIPLPWPTAVPPAGWLKCNGAAFDKIKYPKLAIAYPSGLLPDLRGEFIRGWDDGREVDTGRTILSNQGDAIRNIKGEQSLVVAYNGKSAGIFYNNGKNSNEGIYEDGTAIIDGPPVGGSGSGSGPLPSSQGERIYLDASRTVPTANENRPRNITFNYIVRAA